MGVNKEKTPSDDAVFLLQESLQHLLGNSPTDLKNVLRKCQHACELLAWESQGSWFHQQLSGYYSSSVIPNFRIVKGTKKLEALPGQDHTNWIVNNVMKPHVPGILEEEATDLEVLSGYDWIKSVSESGYREELDELKLITFPGTSDEINMRRIRYFNPSVFANILSIIEKQTFDFVSKSISQISYSGAIGGIWNEYRSIVEDLASKVDLTDHMKAIEKSLRDSNPEAWRAGALSCRNMLYDLANYLWQDNRKYYDYLEGKNEKRKLDVSKDKYVNRISAYIHQKGLSGSTGKHLKNEVKRLASSIRSLVEFQSTAHDPVPIQNAKSIAIATYLLIGELVTRTDLEPIEEYEDPALLAN
jgi:hypothetical protein